MLGVTWATSGGGGHPAHYKKNNRENIHGTHGAMFFYMVSFEAKSFNNKEGEMQQ